MNALTTIPADLLSEAFTCSGSVTAASAPWKSQAIGNLEARLALAWANARKDERHGPSDIVLDFEAATAMKAEIDAAVFEALEHISTYEDLEGELPYAGSAIQASLRRMKLAGRIQHKRSGNYRYYTHTGVTIVTPAEKQREAAKAARDAQAQRIREEADAKAQMITALRADGASWGQVAEKLGLGITWMKTLVRRHARGQA